MITIKVTSGKLYPRAHGKKRYLRIEFTVNGQKSWVSCSQYKKICYLLDKYAFTVTKLRSGIGCIATGPDNLKVAFEYLSFRNVSPPENSELDEIVRKGTTPLEEAIITLCGRAEIIRSQADYNCAIIDGRALRVALHKFPKAEIRFKEHGAFQSIIIDYCQETVPFLKTILSLDADSSDMQIIKAIALQRKNDRRTELVTRFLKGQLSISDVAPYVTQTSKFSPDPAVWRAGLDWLTKNGYTKEVNELIIRKTLINNNSNRWR
jgi:hypothetical protein